MSDFSFDDLIVMFRFNSGFLIDPILSRFEHFHVKRIARWTAILNCEFMARCHGTDEVPLRQKPNVPDNNLKTRKRK